MAPGPPIERLPEELLIHLLNYLDAVPPSETKIREEPSLKLTTSDLCSLKNASLVSKQWRRLVLPSLFRHTRLRLDEPTRRHCPVCTALDGKPRGSSSGEARPAEVNGDGAIDQYHVDLVKEGLGSLYPDSPTDSPPGPAPAGAGTCGPEALHWETSATWIPRFYHNLKDFLDFVIRHELASKVVSFVVMTDQMLGEKMERYPHRAAEKGRDQRYRAAAAFWQHLLSVLDPSRIAIVSPPSDLACLTNCAIDTFGDWAFGDMNFHILDLRLDVKARVASPHLGQAIDLGQLRSTPHRYPGIARSSILNLRPWHQVSINEGCFLRAYSTYEFFERGPPSLVYSIKDCLTPRPTYGANVQRLSDTPLTHLKRLTYIGIFPFANHLDFRELLPQLEELDLQLAPLLESRILDDPVRVGKAQLDDCYSELMTIYQNLAAQLATFRITERNVPHFKKVVCRDMVRKALQDDLDEVFIPLCLPVWAEYERGVFQRLRMSAEEVYAPLVPAE